MDCVFCKIAAGEIPAKRVVEDEHGVAFPDMNPTAPVHVLVIPKKHVASLREVDDPGLLGRLHALALKAAESTGIKDSGFRVVINTGKDANQLVHHLHLHLIGGRHLGWPPG